MTRGAGYYRLLPWLALYLFFNGYLLPQGLLYTALLAPAMAYYLYRNRRETVSPALLLLLLLPVPFQLSPAVDPRSYLFSSALVLTAAIFLLTALLLVKKYNRDLPELFRTLLKLNGFFMVAALLLLPFPPFRSALWYMVPVSAGIPAFPRLKLFTYEASYYALIMMPVLLYFLYRVMAGLERHWLIVAAACLLPLLLSLSFGVIGAAAIAFLTTLLVFRSRLPGPFLRISLYAAVLIVVSGAMLWLLWPGNPVFARTSNIFEGKDTSAMGRLVYSFMFARDLALSGNWFFGIGPGQIKVLGRDLIVNHYHYRGALADVVRIPNAMAELLATYGVYGVALKLIAEAWFFVKCRIWANFYAFTLFVFLFIYQFTGSFLVNVAELGGWAFVFAARFEAFEISWKTGKETSA